MSHKQILVVFGSLMLGLLLASLDNTIVSTAIRTIIGDIGGQNGLARMPWVTTAYVLASTAATPIYGKLSDLFGRKPLYMTAIALFLIGSALSGLSQNLNELIAFRALQGLGAGGIMGLTFAIVGDVVPPRERGKYQGLFGGVFMLAMVAGPLLGGIFTEHTRSWASPAGAGCSTSTCRSASSRCSSSAPCCTCPSARMKATIDYIGAALVVAGVVCLLLAAQMGGQQYALGLPGHHRPGGRRRRGPGGVRALGDPHAGADPADAPVPRRRLPGLQRHGLPHRHGDDGRDDVHPVLLPGRERRQPDQGGPAHAADDGRPADHLDQLRPHHQPDRPLPLLPDRGHRGDHRGPGPDDHHGREHQLHG